MEECTHPPGFRTEGISRPSSGYREALIFEILVFYWIIRGTFIAVFPHTRNIARHRALYPTDSTVKLDPKTEETKENSQPPDLCSIGMGLNVPMSRKRDFGSLLFPLVDVTRTLQRFGEDSANRDSMRSTGELYSRLAWSQAMEPDLTTCKLQTRSGFWFRFSNTQT
jgi:hypothetical protein